MRSASAVLVFALGASACGQNAQPAATRDQARIRRTEYGVPHILADDLRGVAFGQGFAYAQDHACVLADQIVKVRSERASFFGAGANDENIDSDFGYLALDLQQRAEQALAAQSADALDLIEGYVAGYNAFLHSGAKLSADCAGAPWVRDITAHDLMAHILDISLVGIPRVLVPAIGHAAPPVLSDEQALSTASGASQLERGAVASNGWAIGDQRSEHGRGMLLANPHFPWDGDLQLHEAELTVPGRLQAYGASLGGVPGILLGFNEHLAWTHTVSTSVQSVVYRLDLDPDDPTRYRAGKKLEVMTSRSFTISVRKGKQASVTRELYSSDFGPLVDAPVIGWTSEHAAALKTTALSNYAAVSEYLRQALASTLDEFRAAQREERGVQWANTLYADDQGNAAYYDSARVPLFDVAADAAHADLLAKDVVAQIYALKGVTLLDASDPRFAWRKDGVGPDADVSPFEAAPQLERHDFVFNSNENFWLSQPAQPLEARPADSDEAEEPYPFVYGSPRSPRSPRTRMNGLLLSDTSSSGASGDDGLFSLAELPAAILADRSLLAEQLLPELLERCRSDDTVDIDGAAVSLVDTCDALSSWSGRFDAEAGPGALLFREFLSEFSDDELRDAGRLFAQPFDPQDPLHTPAGLAPPPDAGPDPVLVALGRAAQRTNQLSALPDLALATAQHTLRGAEVVPVFGCLEQDGCANVVRFSGAEFNSSTLPALERGKVLNTRSGLTADGYWVNHGTSFLLAVDFTAHGPRAQALLTYGESSDGASPHYRDQLELFAQRKLRPVLFDEKEIAASAELQTQCVAAGGDAVDTTCR